MLSRYDENDLLAIIEGELDDDRLADDPKVRALVAAMKRDREVLRSEPEPRMPHDLAAKIEQALTRPMLIAAWGEDDPASDASAALHGKQRPAQVIRPGEFRRHHQRPARIRRIVRFAMAASVGLLVVGGMWFGINAVIDMRAEHQHRIAQQEREHAERVALAQATPKEMWPPAGSAVHHYAPRPVLERYLAERSLVAPPATRQPAMQQPIAVEFALFISAEQRSQVESSLKEIVSARGEHAALVPHMSRAEARRVLDEFQASHHAAQPGARPQPSAPLARPLAGLSSLAPDFGHQLDYAVRGATHTITIRLSQLPALLEEVEQASLRSALQPLPDITAADRRRSHADSAWITSRSIVREAIAALDERGDDPLIHLPVVIER